MVCPSCCTQVLLSSVSSSNSLPLMMCTVSSKRISKITRNSSSSMQTFLIISTNTWSSSCGSVFGQPWGIWGNWCTSLTPFFQKKHDSSLSITVYRKQHTLTITGLQFPSTYVRRGLGRCPYDGPRNVIISQEDQRKEDHLTGALKQNGYPATFICTFSSPVPWTTHASQKTEPEDSTNPLLVMVPYVAGVDEAIR